jgi:hypothetical protein
LREEDLPGLNPNVAKSKAEKLKSFLNSPLSDADVTAMISAKRLVGSAHRNLVSERAILLHQKNEAMQAGNREELDRIEEELSVLAKEQQGNAKPGSDAKFQAHAEISKRNRKATWDNNHATSQAAIDKVNEKSYDDPFVRRKCQPTNFNAFFGGETTDREDIIQKENMEKNDGEEREKPPVDLLTAHNIDLEIDI